MTPNQIEPEGLYLVCFSTCMIIMLVTNREAAEEIKKRHRSAERGHQLVFVIGQSLLDSYRLDEYTLGELIQGELPKGRPGWMEKKRRL